MKLSLERTEYQSLEIIDNSLFINGTEYKDGDNIIGFVDGVDRISGYLSIYGDSLFFFNKKRSGMKPEEQGHSRKDSDINDFSSWQFEIYSNNFSQGVFLVNYKTEETLKDLSIEDLTTFFEKNQVSVEGELVSINKKYLFKIREFPLCCGCLMLFDFKRDELNHYKLFDEDEIESISEFLSVRQTSKICQLVDKNESQAASLLTKHLNFKEIDTFVNKNTKNKITTYSRTS